MKHKTFYQIDYIDAQGLLNYIYTGYDKSECITRCNILNQANACLNKNTKFVLDKYKVTNEDESELIAENITESETIEEHIDKVSKKHINIKE